MEYITDNLNLVNEKLCTSAGSGLLILMLEKRHCLCLTSNTGAIDMKMDGSVVEEKKIYENAGFNILF